MTSSSPTAAPIPPSSRERESVRLLTRPFVQLLLIQLTFGFSFSTFFLLPKYLKLELSASPSEMGLVIGIGLIVAVAAVPMVGLAIDSLSRPRILLIGTLIGALAALGHCWVSQVGPFLYVLRCVHGIAFVMTFNSAATLAVTLAPKARLSQALGVFGVAMLCTNAIAPAIVEPLAASQGWNAGFVLAAAFASVAGLIATRLPSHHPMPQLPDAAPATRLLNAPLVTTCYASTMMGLGFGSIVTYIQPFALSLGETEVKDLFIGYTITAITVRVALGSLADRCGRRLVAGCALALYGVVTASAAQLEVGYLLLVGLGLGVTHGLAYPALNAIAVEGVAEKKRGLVMTLFNGSFNLGFAVSVLSLGALAEARGFPTVFYAAGVAVMSGVLAIVYQRARPSKISHSPSV